MCGRLLAVVAAVGIASGARQQRRQKSPAISAVAAIDSSGHWSATSPPDLFSSTSLSFTPPGSTEKIINVVVDRDAKAGADQIAALRSSDEGLEMSAILHKDGLVAGSIVDPDEGMVHQFMGKNGGELSFRSTGSDKLKDEWSVKLEEPEELDTEPVVANETIESGRELRVLVLWTKQAECRNAQLAARCSVTGQTWQKMKALVDLAIHETNVAYQKSRINTRLKLAHPIRLDHYVERGYSADLDHLVQPRDGVLDQVHAWRESARAHIVSMISGHTGGAGIGLIGVPRPFKEWMFSVAGWRYATGFYTFGHEIGHNLGGLHDRGAENACTKAGVNYGYRDPAGHWRTVMGYACRADDCMKQPVQGKCTRMQFFSNPDVKYQGKATGWRNAADMARQINSVLAAVGNFYPR